MPSSTFLAPLLELGSLLGHFEPTGPSSTSSVVSIQFHNGNHYEGELAHGAMHGVGRFTWPSGEDYEGEFLHNRMEGHGRLTWKDEARYLGTFQNNVKHGEGQLTFTNGITYKGEWDRGKPNGKGTMHWSPSHYYSGEFQHGLRHGQGEMHYPSGSVYTGEWNKGIRHGTGKMQWVSGDTYQGDWKMGEIHGSGHYRWSTLRNKNFYSSINEYQGEFVKGKRHGQGIFRYADGSCYKGQYKYNQKDSEIGEFTDFTGHLRVGKFVQDQMHARQFSIGLPDWGITQSNLQMELRRYFSFLLQHFRTYKQCFPYDACSSLTRDQFWYLLLPLRKNKIKIYLLDTQLTAALEKSERGSPSDPIPFHVYLKFMLKFHEHWKCLKPPQPTFSNLYAHQRDLVHRIYQKFPSIDLHRLVVWMYRFNPHHDISTCIHAVTEGIPWLIHYQAVFLEYPIVTLEFFQSAYNFFSRDLDINTETGLSVVEEKLEKFFLWVLKSEE